MSGHTGACSSVPVTVGCCFWSQQALAVRWEEGQGSISAVGWYLAFFFLKKNKYATLGAWEESGWSKYGFQEGSSGTSFQLNPLMTPLFCQYNLKVMRYFPFFPLLFEIFSPFFPLPSPQPPPTPLQFYHTCRSACWKHLLVYIYLEC